MNMVQAHWSATDRPRLLWEAAALTAGLLVAVAALVSPLAHWSAVYLWVQAVQSLGLCFIAPPLIVLGAPWLARLASPPWRAWPVLTAAAFNVTWLGWHLPVTADLARTGGAAGIARAATCLGTGILFWLQLIGPRSIGPAASPLRRVALLVGTVAAGTVLGMVLVFGSGVLYPAYAGPAHHVLTVLDDQQLAGAVLWMGMLPPLIITAVALLARWLGDEESQALSAGMDAMLAPRRSAWPSRPGFTGFR